jgi:hypothetical protein
MFKAKIGQLVSWKMGGHGEPSTEEYLGIITEVLNVGNSAKVEFLKNDWIITIQVRNLILLNDVDD